MHVKKWLSWALVLAWMFLIFSFSAQQGSASGSLSGSIVDAVLSVWEFLFPTIELERETVHLFIRKGAHFSVYLILGLFSANALNQSGLKGKKRFGYALLLCALYAASDEWHQSFVPGRGPSAWDVLIDSAGAAVGSGFFGWIRQDGY
ncbi:VanZ family protein [Jeotgalibaca caeni]|uniref:VanZ family protein n=1 Tax=Jeotgalibaca caeni TaxID=3028623 RepID=UPI00237D965A|nr:VanZ family protein [Jeotgalibaca caeni]MDE1548615.1 VanZ family protein [Jeotgalibaca caeni]